jgi:hypothetical protein
MSADRALDCRRLTAGRRTGGQAIVEMLVALVAIVPLYFGVAWLAKVLDMRQATIAAARAVAFECTVRPRACVDAGGHADLAHEVRHRFFARHDIALRSDAVAAGPVGAGAGNAFWTDREGRPMLERFDDVQVSVARVSFDSPLAFAGGQGDRAFPGAVRLLSELGGPGRFGLAIEDGFLDARVRARVSPSRPRDGWVSRLTGMPLTLDAHLAILTDAWTASGPYGPQRDSVETRVEAGARVPGIDTVVAAGWLPVRGLLATGAFLGFESRAGELRWHEIDVDLVPPDRLGLLPPDRPVQDTVPSPSTDPDRP